MEGLRILEYLGLGVKVLESSLLDCYVYWAILKLLNFHFYLNGVWSKQVLETGTSFGLIIPMVCIHRYNSRKRNYSDMNS